MRLKSVIIPTLIFSVFSHFGHAQKSSLEQGMKAGFDKFTDGQGFDDWIQASEDLTELGKRFPSEWLPEYWSAYFYTQVARSFPRLENPPNDWSAAKLLDAAQANLDEAITKAPNASEELKSDFHILQSLIYAFRKGTEQDESLKKEFSDKEVAEINAAINDNPNNPVVQVLVGTKLVNKSDAQSVMGGRALFLSAKQQFGARIVPRYMSTHWNEEWIGFWLERSEGLLTKAN